MCRKVLGILGGMGPLATADFFKELVLHTAAKKDWGHLRVIIDNNVDIPSRTRALLYNEESPAPPMRKACINLISMGCDYIAVPCNSAHFFYDMVCGDSNIIPWINMVEVVAEELKEFKSVLILGGYATVTCSLYDKYLYTTNYLPDNQVVYDIIEEAKLGNINSIKMVGLKRQLFDVINHMGVDCVLLACTELPLVIEDKDINCTLVDGNKIYIKKLIKLCGGKVKDE